MNSRISLAVISAMVLLSGWGVLLPSTVAQPPVIHVRPGDALGEIVSQAPPGSTIIVDAGVYRESLTITQPNIRLIGAGASDEGTVLSNEGVGADNGITVMEGADHFQLSGFLIRGFNENGIWLTGVRDYRITHNVFENNGEYGVFPVFSTGGLIADNVAIGHSDTGIYVGQSSGATIAHNVAWGNINGIEVENSSDCVVSENELFDNVVGILVVELPLLDVPTTDGVLVTRNYVHANNNPGEHRTSEQFIQAVPVGGGILVVGANGVTIQDNVILNNNSFGIGIARLPRIFDALDPLVNHIPDRNRVIGNLSLLNGRNPDRERIRAVGISDFPIGANLFWDGTGRDHCFEDNIVNDDLGGTSFPAPEDLPPCPDEG